MKKHLYISHMKLLGGIVNLFSFYVYLFPFKIYGFEPRLILLFIFFIIYCKVGNGLVARIPKRILKFFLIPIIIAFWSVLCITYNGTSDISFVIYPFQVLYLFALSYAVFYILKFFHGYIDEILIIKYIIATLVVSAIIAILMYVNPTICSFLFELQGIDIESREMLLYFGTRLIGLGCFFFGGGLIYGLGLIFVVLLLLKQTSGPTKMAMVVLYIFLFLVGTFVARTCLIGAAISFLLLAINLFKLRIKKNLIRIFLRFVSSIVFFFVAIVFIYNTNSYIKDNYSQIVDFGFELFLNYFEEGELKTESTEGLKTLYIWPDKISTYIIGDGRFIGDTDVTYYKNTDVGYLRLIYYFGIVGMFLLFMQQYYILRELRSSTGNKYEQQMCVLIFIYILLLNAKGYVDLSPILYLFLHNSLYKGIQREKNCSFCRRT